MADVGNNDERSRQQAHDGGTSAPFDGADYVRWAYRLLLGREPESPATVENNPFKNDRTRLVRSVLDSDEFRKSNSFLWPFAPQSGLTAEFDIHRLRQREKRWDNVAELRRWASAVPMGNGVVLCRTLGKYRQYVSESDIGLSPYVILDGFFEYAVTEFVVRNVTEGMTVMDLGANYGYYTILWLILLVIQGTYTPSSRIRRPSRLSVVASE